jgi:hypothetical protein
MALVAFGHLIVASERFCADAHTIYGLGVGNATPVDAGAIYAAAVNVDLVIVAEVRFAGLCYHPCGKKLKCEG